MGFNLFGTFIPYYGLCIVLGIGCAAILCFFLSKFLSLDFDNCILVSAYLVAAGFLGAKILFLIVSRKLIDWDRFFHDLKYFNFLIGSGFVFYGGFIGGLCVLPLIKKLHKIELAPYIRILTPCVAMVHAFGRIGCSLAGCCYGKITTSDFCFVYSKSFAAPNGVKLFPVQGIEAFCLFVFAAVFAILIIKKVQINLPELYILAYSVLRFCLEFFRGDIERGFLSILSTSQIIALALFAVVCVKKIISKFSVKIL